MYISLKKKKIKIVYISKCLPLLWLYFCRIFLDKRKEKVNKVENLQLKKHTKYISFGIDFSSVAVVFFLWSDLPLDSF